MLLYAPGADPYFEGLVKNADRVFYFDEGPRAEARVVAKAIPRTQKSQTTLEAFSYIPLGLLAPQFRYKSRSLNISSE